MATAHCAGWSDGKRLELTVATLSDLKRRIFKSEHTTLTIDAVGVELDSREEKETSLIDLLEELHSSTAMLVGGSEQGQAFLAELTALKEVQTPWKLCMVDPSGMASIGPPQKEDGGEHCCGEDQSLLVSTGPGLHDLLPSNTVTLSLTCPDPGDPTSMELNIVERPGVSLGSTVFHGATRLAEHMVRCIPPREFRGKRVLELGAGTGITGLTAALLGAAVTLTDLPVLLPVLQANVEANQAAVAASGGTVRACAFSWGDALPGELGEVPFDYIVMADVVYPHLSGAAVYDMLHDSLLGGICGPESVVLMQHQWRASPGECAFFKQCMERFDVRLVGWTEVYKAEGREHAEHPVNTLEAGPRCQCLDQKEPCLKVIGPGRGEGNAVHQDNSSESHGISRWTLLG